MEDFAALALPSASPPERSLNAQKQLFELELGTLPPEPWAGSGASAPAVGAPLFAMQGNAQPAVSGADRAARGSTADLWSGWTAAGEHAFAPVWPAEAELDPDAFDQPRQRSASLLDM
jgi:hypothetical protein